VTSRAEQLARWVGVVAAILFAAPLLAADPPQPTLDLDPTPRVPIDAATRDTLLAIERETSELLADEPSVASRRQVRRLAIALLAAPEATPVARLAGLRLAASRRELDRAIARIHRDDVDPADRRRVDYARLLLARFAESDPARLREAAKGRDADLDAALASILSPLLEALLADAGGEPRSHWPSVDAGPVPAGDPRETTDDAATAHSDAAIASDGDSEGAESDGDGDTGREQTRLLDSMRAFEQRADALAAIEIHRELRALRATLRNSHRRATARWSRTIEEASGDERDLAIAAAIAAASSHAADLERLILLSRLVDSVGAIDRRAMQPAAMRARAIAAPLSQALARPQAVREIDRLLASQPLRPVPFEAELRDSSQPLPEPIASSRTAIADRLDAQRRGWIAAWTSDRAAEMDSNAQSTRLLRELLQIAASGEAASPRGSVGSRLARWAGVLVAPEAIDASIAALAPRVALALDAWLRGDLPATRRHLEGWRRVQPFAAIAIAIDEAIGAELATLRGGAIGAIECLAIPPDRTAFMGDRRRELAELSLLAAAFRHAEGSGDRAQAERLRGEMERRLGTLFE
jgi:hypothetical protein